MFKAIIFSLVDKGSVLGDVQNLSLVLEIVLMIKEIIIPTISGH